MQAHQTPFESTSSYLRNSADKTAAVAFSSAHTPTVYTPFSNESPSNSGSSISGRRNSTVIPTTPPDPGDEPDEYPLGDAWSLLFFAALAAGVIYIKQRKKIEAKG